MTPWSKRLAILLAISVGLNLLLAGFWVGRHFARPGPRPFGPHGPPEMHELGRFGGSRHPALRGALERHRDELRARREATRRARAVAREVLMAPELDRAKLERALADLKAETAKNQELTHRAILEAASEARPEQRRELGRALEGRR